MVKQLILVRHAHRDTSDRSLDNGLSEKGQKQAKWLAHFADQRWSAAEFKELKAVILSSPKRRCLETAEPMAELLRCGIDIYSDLNEQLGTETLNQFKKRVEKFMKWWVQEAPPLVIAISHGDWIPMAMFQATGHVMSVKKGSWLELEWQGSQAELKWYLPTFKLFFAD
jgi:broad specificity phosphatase PhoE